MEGMVIPATASTWNYQERIMELMLSLEFTKSELECAKIATVEERLRNTDYVNKLVELLIVTRRERDEAKVQLQALMEKINQTNPTRPCNSFMNLQPETPPGQQTKGNSSITESQSYVSSPIESIFDTVSSPEFSNMADSSNIGLLNQSSLQDYEQLGITSNMAQLDKDLMNTELKNSKTKSLPEKGKLLQAVMEAGPLLQTLLVAGPLPRWKNPPALQPLQIPPITTKIANSASLIEKPNLDSISSFQNSTNSSYSADFYDGSRIYSSPLHCQNSNRSCRQKRPALSNSVTDHLMTSQSSKGKHRKLQ